MQSLERETKIISSEQNVALVSFSVESHSAAFVADLVLSSSPAQNQC